MAKRIIGVSERLLNCAKKEFLLHGFQDASIRQIATSAETSPRAIYTRFADKEALFDAIVKKSADEFIRIHEKSIREYWTEQNSTTDIAKNSSSVYTDLIDYAYEHMDEFTLILKKSAGTSYANFAEDLATADFLTISSHTKDLDFPNIDVMFQLIKHLTSSFYTRMFDPLFLDMTKEEAHFYVEKMCTFYNGGVKELLTN